MLMDRYGTLEKITSDFISFSKVKGSDYSLYRILKLDNIDNITREAHKWSGEIGELVKYFLSTPESQASDP